MTGCTLHVGLFSAPFTQKDSSCSSLSGNPGFCHWIVGQFIYMYIYTFKYVLTSIPSPLTALSGSSPVQSSRLFHSIPDHSYFLFLAMANMNG